MNYFELYPGDYRRDTARLSLAEHGAYLLLLSDYYGREKPLPAAYADLYRIVGAQGAAEQKAVRTVADDHFPVDEDGLRHNTRADREIEKAQKRIEAARKNGAKHKPKTNPVANPVGSPGVSPQGTQRLTHSGEALHTPHANNNIPETNVSGGDAPLVDPLWHTGLAFMQRKGVPEKQARALLGKLKAAVGDGPAAALLAEADAQDITDPAAWLMAASSKRAKSASTSVAADFRGKSYASTPDDDLPESLR